MSTAAAGANPGVNQGFASDFESVDDVAGLHGSQPQLHAGGTGADDSLFSQLMNGAGKRRATEVAHPCIVIGKLTREAIDALVDSAYRVTEAVRDGMQHADALVDRLAARLTFIDNALQIGPMAVRAQAV